MNLAAMEEGGNVLVTHTTQANRRGEAGGLPGSGLESTNPPVNTQFLSACPRMPLWSVRSTGPLLPSGARRSLSLYPVFTKDTTQACISLPLHDVHQVKCLRAGATHELSGYCSPSVRPLSWGWSSRATPPTCPGHGAQAPWHMGSQQPPDLKM